MRRFLKDKKENKLRKRLVDVLYDLRNKMDSAQLESFEEGFGGELNEKDKKYLNLFRHKKLNIYFQ